jgi:hypothetical protein
MELHPLSDGPINIRMHHLTFGRYSPSNASSFLPIHPTVTREQRVCVGLSARSETSKVREQNMNCSKGVRLCTTLLILQDEESELQDTLNIFYN